MVSLEKNVIPTIEAVYSNFTHIERKIADYFLSEAVETDDLSAKAVSEKLYVSLPSLTRFSQKCGFTGYRQFVYAFQEVSASADSSHVNRNLTRHVLSDYGELLNKTYSLIDEEQFVRVGHLLNNAKRVYIYGQGSSGLVAREIEFRFMRLGMACKAVTDDHMIRMNHVTLNEECLVIGISVSGESLSIINAVRDARATGASTVLLTSKNRQELRDTCDELVLVAIKKNLAQGTIISPQFPVLVVIDIFYAYYIDLDRDARHQLFTNTLSALQVMEERDEDGD
ncbi:RpiR family transcriptional regulator [Streptococcus azizii]|uniref:RpiR family transcriptional regulator n=1 Tax=Streptococcus azizii TaxID=1579424 RepID=A0AB36JQM3_9STRE|nr:MULTISPECIES: MurR/RpiR family transcriptional regulator [Streptococcus]MBF0776194.1 MurR/RpiR family transcriptional regulator [Streptococcus sp. 19428wD3_AN2]ONK28056.1 RpiR family transcriptional regulator [Streptococcus azizii]ONK30454.1 RpiR family transcriptional regulator [Streptococcus azizii]ONK31067.1 RpiR family transcriptional regulator [Streptococcus azizii]TFU83325.1 MurR/RpiR family transcriptional regulator [Streptococcus sp. AN2]